MSSTQRHVSGLALEVLPGRLYWAPARDGEAAAALAASLAAAAAPGGGRPQGGVAAKVLAEPPADAHRLCLQDYLADEFLRGGRYSVPHYRPESWGCACGPLALDQVLAFCGLLTRLLAKHEKIAMVTCTSEPSRIANAALLLGCYLIVMRGWSFAEVCEPMAFDSRLTFPCSWTRPPRGPAVLNVRDCWEGIDMACRFGWLNTALLQDPAYVYLACRQYKLTADTYDAAWIAPGKVLVGADPATVIADPDAATCSALAPCCVSLGAAISAAAAATASDAEPATRPEERPTPSTSSVIASPVATPPAAPSEAGCAGVSEATLRDDACLGCSAAAVSDLQDAALEAVVTASDATADDLAQRVMLQGGRNLDADKSHTGCKQASFILPAAPAMADDTASVHTVCKQYGSLIVEAPPRPQQQPAPDFSTWLKTYNVTQVVRANFGSEPGLKAIGGSYDRCEFERQGFLHVDVPIVDTGGGVPDRESMRVVLEVASSLSEKEAIFIHCKGGFGRSVVMACCGLVACYDLPGRALLGWIRIVRPGAVTTPQQEQFLCSLRGVADLQEYLHKAGSTRCCTVS